MRALINLGACLLALAGPTSTRAADSGVAFASAEFQYRHFHYAEYGDSGARIDEETGWIPGIVVAGGRRVGSLILSGRISGYHGTIDYDGRTTTGVPLRTRTAEDFLGAYAEAEQAMTDSPRGRTGLVLGYGWQRWDRDIHASTTATGIPTLSLFERYQWQYAAAGVTAVAKPASAELTFRAVLLRTVRPRVSVESSTGNDDVTLRQGVRWGLQTSAGVRYPLAPRLQVFGAIEYEFYEFGRSETVPLTRGGTPVGTVFEPRSETSNVSIRLGAELQF